jgi:hypothetical protein
MTTSKEKSPSKSKPVLPTTKPLTGIAIAKAVNPPQLLNELSNLGVKGVVQRTGPEAFVLQVRTRPGHVTDAQIQSAIAAHKPTADPVLAQLQRWGSLSAADKDAILLALARKVYGVK